MTDYVMIRGDRLTVAKYMLEDDFIAELGSDRARLVLYVHEDKPTEITYGPTIDSLDIPKELISRLRELGIERLYDFQWEAYKSIING
ncbi:MAG: DEAD/DEAH box helicase, partial [Vulcanisaeta sp.]|nr:DEAD/DEAH box helicase [Vulcanisaeta sp.]